MAYSYPLIHDQLKVVPAPFTHEVPVPKGVVAPPNALCLVRHIGGLHPHFPSLPYTFSVPGHSLNFALAFVKAMRATVRWNQHRCVPNPLTEEKIIRDQSFGRLNYFKIEFSCPCQGYADPPLNSHKSKHVSAQCGFNARFSIKHHIPSDSLQVTWFWKHSHDPNSHNNMVLAQPPIAVDYWLKERVKSGLSWKAIHNLIHTPFIRSIVLAEVILKDHQHLPTSANIQAPFQLKSLSRPPCSKEAKNHKHWSKANVLQVPGGVKYHDRLDPPSFWVLS
ncbi:hypothetical protein PCANC_18857 [Puccinia coronata f. sp. avenae]|uniref:Uncharacterized protein n=1 Tax=Puccinia coronata f. sp. avenae TaxID=200324 RepID=A0A2N5U8G0_9BASI|nr:hypothetical protein PCANC_18857 [Puccinia coronata f. sp. avenae]